MALDRAIRCGNSNSASVYDDRDELEDNEILIYSVMFRLIQVSENSDKLTAEFKAYYKTM